MAGRTMSTLSLRSKIREDYLTCTICFTPFNKPKALPCLHTFCENCLRDYVLGRGFDTAGKFPCPVCRQETSIPHGGVKEFPDNYHIANLQDTVEKKKTANESSSGSSGMASTCTSDGEYSFLSSSDPSSISEDQLSQYQYETGFQPQESEQKEATAPELMQQQQAEQVTPTTPSVEGDFVLVPRENTVPADDICYPHFPREPNVPPPRPPHPPAFPPNTSDVNRHFMSQSNQDRSNFVVDGFANLNVYEPVNYPHIPQELANTSSEVLSNEQYTPCSRGLSHRFGQYGMSEIDFRIPYGLAIGKKNEILVTDRSGSRILIFSHKGHLLSRFNCDCKIAGVTLMEDNKILVAVSSAKKAIMRVYNFDGKLLGSYGDFYSFENPSGIAFMSNGHVVISNIEGHNLLVFTNQMKFSQKIGWKGSGDNHFMYPNFVYINSKNNIIVSDSGNDCIKVLTPNGTFKRKIASSGSSHGCLSCPMGLATDADNNIYVADAGNYRVEVFTSKGVYVRSVVEDTDMIKPDTKPLNVAVNSQGNVVVLLKGPDFAEIRIYMCKF